MLDEDISVWTGDSKAATKVREIENADYDALHKDYSESISALERAIAVLKKQAHNRKQAAMVQVEALKTMSLIPTEAKRVLNSFLQQDPSDEGLAVSAPEAEGYEFWTHECSMMRRLQHEDAGTLWKSERLISVMFAQLEVDASESSKWWNTTSRRTLPKVSFQKGAEGKGT